MSNHNFAEKVRQRYQELNEQLLDALNRAVETKAQYDELDALLRDVSGLDKDLADRLQKMRQSKLAENNLAVDRVRDLQARLKIHEELMKVMEADENAAK